MAPPPADDDVIARVKRCAALAHLALDEPRAEGLAGEVDAILAHFRLLAEVDVAGVEPLVRPDVPHAGPRRDDVAPSSPRERLQAAAPDVRDGFYAVPKTVERSDSEPPGADG